jgi:hypothetical protein
LASISLCAGGGFFIFFINSHQAVIAQEKIIINIGGNMKKIIIFIVLLKLLFIQPCEAKNQMVNMFQPAALSSNSSFPICTVDSDQGFARSCYNSTDKEYLVVWKDFRVSGAASQTTPGVIYGQLISQAGKLIGGEIPISIDNPTIIRYQPTSCYNPILNEYFVIYLKDWDLYGRFIKSDGSPRGDEFVISNAAGDQMHPAIEYNSKQQNYFIVWNDTRKGSNESDIYGIFINSDGGRDGEEFLICDAPKDQFAASMAYNPAADEFLITWEDFRYCTKDPCYSDLSSLYGQRIKSDGTFVGDEFLITSGEYDSRQQNLAFNPNRNEYLIAWNDKRNQTDEANIDIYARKLGTDGALLGDNFSICTAPKDQGYCTVSYDPINHNYLMAWSDFRVLDSQVLQYSIGPLGANVLYGEGTVYGRWLNDAGEYMGSEFIICEESKGHQMLAKARYYLLDGRNGIFFIVWSDDRNENTGFDIYGEFIETETCPASILLTDDASLNLLRLFRDTVLAKSAQGKKYIDLYYQHAAEVSSLIDSDVSIKQTATALLKELLPSIQSMIQGNRLFIPKHRENSIESLLNLFTTKASAGLKTTIAKVKRDIQYME